MSIPKLKVYRLDNNYSQASDNDIQSISNDQMLPIVQKNLNVFDMQEMVGVKQRSDSRMVVGSQEPVEYEIPIDQTDKTAYQTVPYCCQGWCLGKGNIDVFIKITNASSSSSQSSSSGEEYVKIDKKFWDYDIIKTKRYRVYLNKALNVTGAYLNNVWFQNKLQTVQTEISSGNYVQLRSSQLIDMTSMNKISIYTVDEIVFKFGDLLIRSNAYYNPSYSLYVPFHDELNIKVSVIPYYQLCQGSENIFGSSGTSNTYDISSNTYSRYRNIFGNVYDGNKTGRKLAYKSSSSTLYNTEIPTGSLKEKAAVSYYQGNYIYKRKTLPLRMIVAKRNVTDTSNQVYDNDYVFDSTAVVIDQNGTFQINADEDWYFDGLMKPIIMQKIIVGEQSESSKRKIFKQLSSDQYTMTLSYVNDKPVYNVSFNSNYYLMQDGTTKKYPSCVFFVYNKTSDNVGNIFDFTYHDITKDYNGYFSNDGRIYSNLVQSKKIFNSDDTTSCNIFLRKQKLAVLNDYGYDSERDLLLNFDGLTYTFNFNIPEYVSFDNQMRIYVNGEKIWGYQFNGTVNLTSYIVEEYQDFFEITLNSDSKQITIQLKNVSENKFSTMKDLLFVYHEKHKITHVASNGTNPQFFGYRIPCYEKVKTTDLFVSSFPNWVKGHLNNDLDVFFGNTTYSGTQANGNNIDSIFPCYQKDGWYVMYPEGSVRFNQQKTEYDYFDIFNFASRVNSNITVEQNVINDLASLNEVNLLPNYANTTTNYSLYYQKVKCNVAHYDGVYSVVRSMLSNYTVQGKKISYALLEDDDFEQVKGKRIVVRDDNYIRRMYQIGSDQMPSVLSSNLNQKEMAVPVSQIEIDGINKKYLRVNTNDDRVTVIRYNHVDQSGTGLILCFDPFFTEYSWNEYSGRAKNITFTDLTNNDLRVHVSLNNSKNCLCFGIQQQDNLNNEARVYYYQPVKSNFSVTDSILFVNPNMSLSGDVNVQWFNLEPMEDVYDEISIDQLQTLYSKQMKYIDNGNGRVVIYDGEVYKEYDALTETSSVSESSSSSEEQDEKGKISRFIYSNKNWYYDICFEVFSYRYKNETYNGINDSNIDGVQFVVYKIDK